MPTPFIALVLVLAAYRLTRLAGWDDFPLAARIRAWVIGERWVPTAAGETLGPEALATAERLARGEEPELPGKQPPSEVWAVRPAYDRPTLAHLVHCPFCIGWWISLATWVAWLCWHPVEYGLMPFAISGAVGLIAKNLDP